MKRLLAILATISLVSCSNKGPNYADYWLQWGDAKLTEWQVVSSTFSDSVFEYCLQNGSLSALRESWRSLALQWASLNGLPYHAITDFSLGFELQFWPDKRNMTAVRLNNRISQGILTQEQLTKATAAEKGLVAMEWLSFEPELTLEQRCNVLPAITEHYLSNVERVSEYHQGNPLVQIAWAEEFDSPEGQSISLNLLFQQIAQISNRLRSSVGSDGNLVAILAEGWRAGISEQIYLASLDVAIEHLQALAERAPITVNSRGLLADQINVLRALSQQMQAGAPDWPELQQAMIDTEGLIEGPIAQDLDILIGFNNYDGD